MISTVHLHRSHLMCHHWHHHRCQDCHRCYPKCQHNCYHSSPLAFRLLLHPCSSPLTSTITLVMALWASVSHILQEVGGDILSFWGVLGMQPKTANYKPNFLWNVMLCIKYLCKFCFLWYSHVCFKIKATLFKLFTPPPPAKSISKTDVAWRCFVFTLPLRVSFGAWTISLLPSHHFLSLIFRGNRA